MKTCSICRWTRLVEKGVGGEIRARGGFRAFPALGGAGGKGKLVVEGAKLHRQQTPAPQNSLSTPSQVRAVGGVLVDAHPGGPESGGARCFAGQGVQSGLYVAFQTKQAARKKNHGPARA